MTTGSPDSGPSERFLAVGTGVTERPPRALVADDDPEVRAYVDVSLQDAGFLVEQAADGADALMRIDASRPDLVIADLEMPGLGGRQLLEALRHRHETAALPFIVLTGSADTATRVACLDAGANDVLAKPIDAAELAARARLQLRTARTMRRLRTASEVDQLTEVLNRRGLMRALERELARCRRDNSAIAIILADVDRFKEINDDHGHLAGDRVLRAIADTLAACVRASDTVGRLGGDEFVLVLPDADAATASAIADRIRARAAAELRVPGTDRPVALSLGIVAEPVGAADVIGLLGAADREMYRDKRGSQPANAAQ